MRKLPVIQHEALEEARYLVFVWASPESAPLRMYRLDEADALVLILSLVEEFGLDPEAVYEAIKKARGNR